MMKDTAMSYDLAQHHHQQPQQTPQQHHSWNQQRQQQLGTHTTSIYSNHHEHLHQTTQQNSHSRQPQQQSQQHDAHLGQYSHQQLQSATAVVAVAPHHNATNSAAAYYQQTAHLYSTYHGQEQQQQQSVSDHHSHHHPVASVSTPNTAAASALNAAVVAAQQHAANGASSGGPLNHSGWPPAGVGALAAAATAGHHAVVTDHSLAYMTHAYQSHDASAVSDHHRSSTGPLASQPIGSAAQAPTYTVDALYSTPVAAAAAAAAAAAYGYNNYNAAFFQTSDNGPHAQTGHPTPDSISTFWNQSTQQHQQRTTHTQTMPNQAAVNLQQRQQHMASDQTNNYLHDPRLYAYGRPQFNQNAAQNFSLHQQQTDMQQQQQQQQHPHHRLSTNLSHQYPLVQQHQLDPSSQSVTNQVGQQAGNNQSSSLPNHQQSTLAGSVKHCQQHLDSENRKLHQTLQVSSHHHSPHKHQKDFDSTKANSEFDQLSSNQKLGSQQKIVTAQQHQGISGDEIENRLNIQVNKDQHQTIAHQDSYTKSVSPVNKSQTVIKSEPQAGQYQSRKSSTVHTSAQSNVQQPQQGSKNAYRVPQEDRIKSQTVETPSKKLTSETKDNSRVTDSSNTKGNQTLSTINSKQQNVNDQASSLEENMASLSINPRKTTWASIASQPAKVSQPKSLKSKIAGTNSVLSTTNKHLTSSVTIDSSNLDSKNGINPAIKSSVSTAATSMTRGSAPPPVSKVNSAPVANLNLDLTEGEGTDSKISWPAVNASINLTLEDTLPPKLLAANTDGQNSKSNNNGDRLRRDDGYRSRDAGQDSEDHNHNQGSNSKFINSYSHRDDRRPEDWHRREPREYRSRREMDRRGEDNDKRLASIDHGDLRDHLNSRRDFKSNRGAPGHFRQQDDQAYQDFKRGSSTSDRKDHRMNGNYRFSGPVRGHDLSRDATHHIGSNSRQQADNVPHHHYNNLRDGSHLRVHQSSGKLDLNVHPHLNPDNFNPKTFDCKPENARFFIIKSYSEDDIHRSIKYSVWCSTNHGNKRLDEAYKQQQARKGQLFLFFSVNGSGHFCGMAQMTSNVDFESSSGIWAQSKWQGEFNVKWIYVKDVPNSALRHITLENNEDKPVTNSRDTQEVPSEKGKAVLKIIHKYHHQTSLFDDFLHYERRQEEEKAKKSSQPDHHLAGPPISRDHDRDRGGGGGRFGRSYVNNRPHNDFPNRDRMTRYA